MEEDPPPEWRDIRAEFAREYGVGAVFPSAAGERAEMWKDLEEFTGAVYDHKFKAWQKRTGNLTVPKATTIGMTLDEFWATHGRGGEGNAPLQTPGQKRELTHRERTWREDMIRMEFGYGATYGGARSLCDFSPDAPNYNAFWARIDALIPAAVLCEHEFLARRESHARADDYNAACKALRQHTVRYIWPHLNRALMRQAFDEILLRL